MNNIEIAYVGVKIVAEILDFPEPKLLIIEESQLRDKGITGIYRFKDNKILFNENWILRSTWIEVMITTYHEMRHAYQAYCIKTKSRESKSTLENWEYETLNYIMPSGKNDEKYDAAYLNQEIEIDAIAFSHKLVNEHFGLKTVIPVSIRNKVENKMIATKM